MKSGWATRFEDFDNDGLKDLFVTASHVNDLALEFENASHRQSNAVFGNTGRGTFEEVSEVAAAFMPAAHRGAAFADFDRDGLVDAVVSVIGGPAELWQNVSPAGNRWLGIRLIGTTSNSDGIGARVHVGSQVLTVGSSSGYASSSLAPAHFGLGPEPDLQYVRIAWPGGAQQTAALDGLDRVMTITEELP